MENNHENDLVLSKELIIECVQKGSSDFAFMKMASERKLHGQGGTIKTRAKEYLTSKLFDKPVNINDVTCGDDIDDQYLYRHAFGTKTDYTQHSQGQVLKVSFLKQHDQYENLTAKKEKLIEEILQMYRTPIDLVHGLELIEEMIHQDELVSQVHAQC